MNRYYYFVIIGLLFCTAPQAAIVANNDQSTKLKVCALCSRALPAKSILLSCNHPACVACLQPWVEKKSVCLRCQESKQRNLHDNEQWKSRVRVGLGMTIGVVLVAAKMLVESVGHEKIHLPKPHLPT